MHLGTRMSATAETMYAHELCILQHRHRDIDRELLMHLSVLAQLDAGT